MSSKLINIIKAADEAAAPADLKSVGVFVTPQSLATFPGAVAVITFLWRVLAKFWPQSSSEWTVLLLSFLVGGVIYLMSSTEGQTAKEKIVSFFIAVVNCFALAAAVLGVETSALPSE